MEEFCKRSLDFIIPLCHFMCLTFLIKLFLTKMLKKDYWIVETINFALLAASCVRIMFFFKDKSML